jgi:hypothetical protein
MTVPRRRRTPDGGSYTRDTSAPELAGMAPMDFARWLHGREPTQAEARRVYRIAGGETDPGVQWVAAVLKRLPLVDARAFVAELARRLAARGRGT